MHVVSAGVHRVAGTHLSGQGQFLVVNVGSNDGGTALCCTHHGSHAHHATANDQHHVDVGDLGTAHGVEAHTHRLDEGTGAGREQPCGNDLLPGQDNKLAHGTITLHAQRLVVLARIDARVAARSTLATVGIGIHRDHHAGLQALGHIGSHTLDHGTHLMAGNDRHAHHGVLAQISTEVGTTKSYILQAQEHLVGLHLLCGNVYNFHLAQARNLYCFHLILTCF